MKWQPERAIKAGRAISNMTQSELADRLTAVTGEEWTRNMIASLEAGRRTFDVATMAALSKIQGLPYSFYLEGINVDNPGYHELNADNPLASLRNTNQSHDPVRDAIWVSLERAS